MSVASKTKTKMYTTVVLGIVAAISALPTWADTTPGTSSVTVDQPVVSTQGTQDLSVLRSKLKERFSGVAQEITSLVNGETKVEDSLHGAAARTIDVSQGMQVKPVNLSQDFFVDIQNDPYRTYINRLAAYGVLSSSQKFYPQNYFRVDDFVGLVQKLYEKSFSDTAPEALKNIQADDGVMTKRQLQQIISVLGDRIAKIDIYGNPYDKLIRSEGSYYLVRMFSVPSLETTENSSSILPNYFNDIAGHPYAEAINTLASLGIVSVANPSFYPDNYIRHYDFVMIFVNSLMSAQSRTLSSTTVSPFADVNGSVPYLSQLVYASDRGLVDPLVQSKNGQLYFLPDAFMTKEDAYTMLGNAFHVSFFYDKTTADSLMTRGELAEAVVDGLGLSPAVSSGSVDSSLDSGSEDTIITKLKVLLSML